MNSGSTVDSPRDRLEPSTRESTADLDAHALGRHVEVAHPAVAVLADGAGHVQDHRALQVGGDDAAAKHSTVMRRWNRHRPPSRLPLRGP